MAPENKIQKNRKELIFDSQIAGLILRLEPTDVKKLNSFQVSTRYLLPINEHHPVQKIKVKTVKPTTQNCDRVSIRLKNMQTA